jgi:predicted dinucleotide-binding enzyme
MKIAILGTGRVGSMMAKRWAALGHTIVFGTHDATSDKTKAVLAEIPGAGWTLLMRCYAPNTFSISSAN